MREMTVHSGNAEHGTSIFSTDSSVVPLLLLLPCSTFARQEAIAAGARRNIELEPGTHRVLVINDNGRILESERVELSRFETERFEVARRHASNNEPDAFQADLWELMFDVLFEALADDSTYEEADRFNPGPRRRAVHLELRGAR